MAKLTIWYSVSNGGDGSAYPNWFETERLTEMDQELMHEGWGETCNGSLTVEGDNLKMVTPFTTREQFLQELKERLKMKWEKPFHNQIKEFIQELETELGLPSSLEGGE